MANRDIFSKHLTSFKLSTRLDAEGHEVQVEPRQDVDAIQKEQETFDILVAAGYYRAKIRGLAAFDKVVGGMTWCIECSDYGVDVDLLFHENLTIGQKIALVEKIVSVLPKMSCPYGIEPHQIQGLEFLSIFPVIKWLVKTSVENRTERSQRLKKFAVGQFHINYQYKADKENLAKIRKASEHIKCIQELHGPRRLYQQKFGGATLNNEENRTLLTLAEYGWHKKISRESSETNKEYFIENEIEIEQMLENLHLVKKPILAKKKNIFEPQKRYQLHQHYAKIKLEIECRPEALIDENKEIGLEATDSSLIAKLQIVEQENKMLKSKLEHDKTSFYECQQQEQSIKENISTYEDIENNINAKMLLKVQNLLILHDELKKEEGEFKDHCRKNLIDLEKQIENLKIYKILKPDQLKAAVVKEKDTIQDFKLQIAKKNRGILALQKELDIIPDPVELAQYQERFLELYNEMSTKHLETKQYFALYNALNDQKIYIEKELSLLNSICDTYNETVRSTHGREQFVQQMEKVAEDVRQSEAKMAQKYNEECQRHDELNEQLQGLHELQRHYVAAVRQLTKECQRCEQFQQHLRSIRTNTSL